jgi:hypothetical protein
MGPTSRSITLVLVGKACQGPTLQLIGPIYNIRKMLRPLGLKLDGNACLGIVF